MNTELNTQLELLVVFLWQKKKLSFSEEEYPNISLLEKEGVIKLIGSEFTLANYNLLAPFFLAYYKNIIGFEYNSDFSQTVLFIKRLKDDFFVNGYVHGFSSLKKEIWNMVVAQTNNHFHNDFYQYINDLNKEDRANNDKGGYQSIFG